MNCYNYNFHATSSAEAEVQKIFGIKSIGILSFPFLISLLLGNFVSKFQHMFNRHGSAIFADFARLDNPLTVKFIDKIHELFCFILFL